MSDYDRDEIFAREFALKEKIDQEKREQLRKDERIARELVEQEEREQRNREERVRQEQERVRQEQERVRQEQERKTRERLERNRLEEERAIARRILDQERKREQEEEDKQLAQRLAAEEWRHQIYTPAPLPPPLPAYSTNARTTHINSVHDMHCSCRTWNSFHCQVIHNKYCRYCDYAYSPQPQFIQNNILNTNKKHIHGWRCCRRLDVNHVHSKACPCIYRQHQHSAFCCPNSYHKHTKFCHCVNK